MTVEEVIDKFLRDKILIQEQGKIVLSSKYYPKTSKTLKNQEFQNLLETYANLWPKKIKSGNRLIRKSPNSLRTKLLAFTKLRKDISSEVILDATKYYLKGAKQQGWEYTISADYFISKFGSSELEATCDLVIEGKAKVAGEDNFIISIN